MRTYLQNLFERVSQSLWFLPSLSISLAVLTAYLMLEWEAAVEQGWGDLPFMVRSDSETSLTIVATIVGSLITVAGVTFSITIVSLTLASSQFGPRLLRNFLRSGPSQMTLGALTGSFVYGILIMPGIDGEWKAGEAHPAVTLMIALAFLCVGLIVYYIHHVATSIQADELVASVYREIEDKIKKLPDLGENRGEKPKTFFEASEPNIRYRSCCSGYVTAIDCAGLLQHAKKRGGKIEVLKRPGKFVARGECLAYGFEGDWDDDFSEQMGESIFVSDKRTPEQDLEFLIDQLVEVALRAISPGINDPNTAIVCIDYLSAAFIQLSSRALPESCTLDEEGAERVFVPLTDFEGLIDGGFNQLRQAGQSYPGIMIRLMAALHAIASEIDGDEARREVLRRQFDQLVETYEADRPCATKDRDDIEARISEFRERFD